MQKSLQSWVGELVGTFIFVSIICASVILSTGAVAGTGLVGIGLAQAFALGAAITAFARISGAHFNPVVTLSAWIGGKISSADALGYVACQIFGALGAGLFLRMTFTEAQWGPSNIGTPALSVTTGKGLLVEAVLTFIFVMIIWGAGIDERNPGVSGFAIGAVLGAMVIGFGPITGPAMNPARFLGPGAVAGNLDDWWVYFLGPAIGGVAAGLLYPMLFQGGFRWPLSRESLSSVAAPEDTGQEDTGPLDTIVEAPARAPAKRKPARRKPAARKR